MRPQAATLTPLRNWPEALIDPERFREEQSRLAGIWTLLGFTHDIPDNGDWFRTNLATRSVLVQRFGGEIRGFEQRCVRPLSLLRDKDMGNGPIVCPVHRQHLNGGGAEPSGLAACLSPIETATCGALIFGRCAAAGNGQTLRQFLGEPFDILAAFSRTPVRPQRICRSIEANWRICFHANVEDYHPVTVHPATFGKNGYVNLDEVSYFRFGWHSAYFTTTLPDALTRMAAECRDGVWRSANYRVFHIFPDLTVAHFRTVRRHYYIAVIQYAAATENRSTMRAWFYPAPFADNLAWWERWTRPIVRRASRFTMPYFVGRVLGEDDAYSVKLQSIAQQLSPAPLLGALEQRLGWFEEAYAEAMGA